MSLTITRPKRTAPRSFVGGLQANLVDIDFDSSYDADGETVSSTTANIRADDVVGVSDIGGDAEAALYTFKYNHLTNKLLAFRNQAGQIIPYAPGGGDIKGSTNLAGTEGDADQNATAVNGALLLAKATFTALAGTMTPTVQPDVPRNIVIQIENDSGGALDLFEGTTTFLITGTDANGAAQTESVTLVSTSGNKSVANTKFRFIQGSKAFRTVTSVAITNAPAGGLKGSLGIGSRLGLPAPLETAVHTSVLSLTVNAARVATGATVANAGGVDTTNNTINAGTLANGDDVGVIFKAAAQQVQTGTDLSGVKLRAIIYTLPNGA